MADANSTGTPAPTDPRLIRYQIAVAALSVACLGLLITLFLQLRGQFGAQAEVTVLKPEVIVEALDADLLAIRHRRSSVLDAEEAERLNSEEAVARVLAAVELNATRAFSNDAATQADAEARLSSILENPLFETASDIIEVIESPEVVSRAWGNSQFAFKVTLFVARSMKKNTLKVDHSLQLKIRDLQSLKNEIEKRSKDILEGQRPEPEINRLPVEEAGRGAE